MAVFTILAVNGDPVAVPYDLAFEASMLAPVPSSIGTMPTSTFIHVKNAGAPQTYTQYEVDETLANVGAAFIAVGATGATGAPGAAGADGNALASGEFTLTNGVHAGVVVAGLTVNGIVIAGMKDENASTELGHVKCIPGAGSFTVESKSHSTPANTVTGDQGTYFYAVFAL